MEHTDPTKPVPSGSGPCFVKRVEDSLSSLFTVMYRITLQSGLEQNVLCLRGAVVVLLPCVIVWISTEHYLHEVQQAVVCVSHIKCERVLWGQMKV